MKERKIAAFALLAAMWFIAVGARAQSYPVPAEVFSVIPPLVTGVTCTVELGAASAAYEAAAPPDWDVLSPREMQDWNDWADAAAERIEFLEECGAHGLVALDRATALWGIRSGDPIMTALSDAIAGIMAEMMKVALG